MAVTGYWVFPTLAGAKVRSALLARARGCQPGDVTQFWLECRPHPTLTGGLILLDDSRPDFSKLVLALGERTSVETDPTILDLLNNPGGP